MTRALIMLAVLGGCASARPTPVGQPPAPSDPPICLTADPEPLPGSCGARYTSQGFSCALCQRDRACVDAMTFTYCVNGLACDDPACGARMRTSSKP